MPTPDDARGLEPDAAPPGASRPSFTAPDAPPLGPPPTGTPPPEPDRSVADPALRPEPAPTSEPSPFVADPALDGEPAGASEPFAPPSDAWRRVSPKLATVKRIGATIWVAILVALGLVGWWLFLRPIAWVPVLVVGLGLALWLWRVTRAGRVVAAMGWARRDEDLCYVEGLWWRQLTVVPFGRMQVVKVSSGPVLRAFGLSNVELVTAGSMVSVEGLPTDEAKELRDLIISLSDAKGSGL